MAGKILLEVVTPEKQLLSQQVDEVIAPGSEGEFGVLPGHCHFLSTLRIGELLVQKGVVSPDQIRIALTEQRKNLTAVDFYRHRVVRDNPRECLDDVLES